MARRRRRRRPWIIPVFVLSAAAVSLWWWSDYPTSGELSPELVLSTKATQTAEHPARGNTQPNHSPLVAIKDKEKVRQPVRAKKQPMMANMPAASKLSAQPSTTNNLAALLSAGKAALQRKDLVTARTQFSEALPLADGERATFLRTELSKLGLETIFSSRIVDGDPHVERYVIKPGDTLGKIAKAYQISADLLAHTNNIRNVNLIRAGQAIKVIKGPFRAAIHKRLYTLDLYLGDTFVKYYKVGLGTDNSTPTGQWRVGTKLKNPTYYPPRTGLIVSSDDPKNPLGERWIGLVGIRGEALGQERYGIHGTIEPSSIGKDASLGCVRMYNKDVEELYMCLVERHSDVTIN